jgi:phospholipase C
VDSGEARERLGQVEHIIVVMMENRSFDHMLGYLSLPAELGGKGRTDVDGLTSPEVNVNYFDGEPFAIAPMGGAGLTKVQDPGHSGSDVGQQMAHGMGGFVANYMTTRAYQQPGDVMRYQRAENVPVYNFFAENFAICDRWFCSVPGSTWPNRVTALTGEARSTDNKFPPLYARRSFARTLDQKGVSWKWYSSDPGSLRLVDDEYRTRHEEHFAYVDKPSFVQPHTFWTDAMKEELPSVSWIDPNFVDLGGLQGANDDHPPTDVMSGQSFIMKIYQSLKDSALWEKSMLVIVYDEHGGFYDHVDPSVGMPPAFTNNRCEFRHFGPRVPAIVVSPFVTPGAAFGSAQGADPCFHFDHTALIKTILLRFADDDCTGLPERVNSSSHLGHLLTGSQAGPAPEIPQSEIERVSSWWGDNIALQLKYPAAKLPALQELGIVEGPSGGQAAAQTAWSVLARVRDWIAGLFGKKAAPKPAAKAGEDGSHPAVLADASELQLGIAAASRKIREDGLQSGQP